LESCPVRMAQHRKRVVEPRRVEQSTKVEGQLDKVDDIALTARCDSLRNGMGFHWETPNWRCLTGLPQPRIAEGMTDNRDRLRKIHVRQPKTLCQVRRASEPKVKWIFQYAS
jgi:hypothetical protein